MQTGHASCSAPCQGAGEHFGDRAVAVLMPKMPRKDQLPCLGKSEIQKLKQEVL